MSYRITKQYIRGGQIPEAEFDDLNEAKLFVRNKMNDDARLKVKVTYRLFSGMKMLEEFDPETFSATTDSGTQQSSNRSGFSPTPLNTAPRPPGSLPNWWKDEDKKE